MKKINEVLYKLFGWGIYISLVAGGLAFFGFLLGIIIGGASATQLAVFLHKQYFPIIIKIASITIGLGLVGMYLNKEQALSLVTDKKEAEEEMAKIKGEQIQG
ncbi:MAG TPA: hypothetical protein VIM29_03040 [Bacillota bacterium]